MCVCFFTLNAILEISRRKIRSFEVRKPREKKIYMYVLLLFFISIQYNIDSINIFRFCNPINLLFLSLFLFFSSFSLDYYTDLFHFH